MGSTEDYFYRVWLPEQRKKEKEAKTAKNLIELVEEMKKDR